MLRSIFKFLTSLFVPLALGYIAGQYTSEAIPGWFESLNKPSFNPPGWIFGPVWTLLYILMGLSFFHIWIKPRIKERTVAKIIYIVQLLLNFAWSFLFFYYHDIALALIDIIVLDIVVVIMLLKFYQLKPTAAYLNIPYLLWILFA
ncbi:MAG TPA: tryptophan-rich sensory protein, partial [Bacteroidales bacterium]|nr:tryptophan-rich sensory protein [Bacteroidales bacterium]